MTDAACHTFILPVNEVRGGVAADPNHVHPVHDRGRITPASQHSHAQQSMSFLCFSCRAPHPFMSSERTPKDQKYRVASQQLCKAALQRLTLPFHT